MSDIQAKSNQTPKKPGTAVASAIASDDTGRTELANSPRLGFDVECKAQDCIKSLKEHHEDSAAHSIEHIVQSASHNRFTVAIVGNSGSGKSTFANQIMGIDVLPANPWRTTTIATRLCYGSSGIATLVNSQGAKELEFAISQQTWKEAYNCQGHFDKAASDKRIYAKIPSNWLKKSSLELIDTPSLDIGPEAIYSLCMGCDGIVFMTDANQALGKDERSFIEEWILDRKIPFFAIAISKIDLVPEEQREALLTRIASRVSKLGESNSATIPLLIASTDAPSCCPDKLISGSEAVREQLQAWSHSGRKSLLKDSWALCEIEQILIDVAQKIKRELEDAEEEFAQETKDKKEEAQRKLDEAELQFCLLNAGLIERQRELLVKFESKVDDGSSDIVEKLCYSATSSNNPAEWLKESYERSREMHIKSFANSANRWLEEEIGKDLAWYARSLLNPYGISLESCLEKGRDGKPAALLDPNKGSSGDLQIADAKQLNKGAQIASTAAVLAGGALGHLVGIPSGGIIAGMLARLAAGGQVDNTLQNQKKMICGEIEDDIPAALNEAVFVARTFIRSCYEEIEQAAKSLQEKWIEDQKAAIDEIGSSGSKKAEKIAQVYKQTTVLVDNLPDNSR